MLYLTDPLQCLRTQFQLLLCDGTAKPSLWLQKNKEEMVQMKPKLIDEQMERYAEKKNHVILTVSPEYGKSYQHSLSGLLMHVASREQQGKQLMQILLKLQYGKG